MVQDYYSALNEIFSDLKNKLFDLNAQIQCNREDKILIQQKKDIENKIRIVEKVLRQENQNFAVLNLQEMDRKRIAEDLHDMSLQNLTHLIHKIELCSMYIDQDPVKAKLELSVISEGIKETVNEIRNIIFDLRPMTFEDLGWKACIEKLLEKFNETGKYRIISDIDDVSCENDRFFLSIYRAVQESLNNIDKHAEAEQIELHCKVINDVCVIDISDDGKGFYDSGEEKRENRHFGISMMKERIALLNGRINIDSAVGKGTKVHMEIPLCG